MSRIRLIDHAVGEYKIRPYAVRRYLHGLISKIPADVGGQHSCNSKPASRVMRIALQPRRADDQTRTQANIAKARRILGYNPTTTPQQGLAQTVAWYRAQR